MKNKLLIVGSIILTLLTIFMIAVKLYRNSEAEKTSFLTQENAKILMREYSPRLGAENPQVYLVEFLDPECESCREFYPIVKGLMSEFEGKIQLIIRYAPFHPNSIMAIRILEAARIQNRYWETLELLFQYQPQWGSHHHPQPELLWNYLPQLNLDLEKLRADMATSQLDILIEQEINDANLLEVRATPTFFVNGKPLINFGRDELRNLILSELD